AGQEDQQETRRGGRLGVEGRLDLRRRSRQPRQDGRRRAEQDYGREGAEDRDAQDEEHAARKQRRLFLFDGRDGAPAPGQERDRQGDERSQDPEQPARDAEVDEGVDG